MFMNPPSIQRRVNIQRVLQDVRGALDVDTNVFYADDGTKYLKESSLVKESTLESLEGKDHEDNEACYQAALAMCPALNFLHLTLKHNALVRVVELETVVIQNVKK